MGRINDKRSIFIPDILASRYKADSNARGKLYGKAIFEVKTVRVDKGQKIYNATERKQ